MFLGEKREKISFQISVLYLFLRQINWIFNQDIQQSVSGVGDGKLTLESNVNEKSGNHSWCFFAYLYRLLDSQPAGVDRTIVT